MRHFVAAQSVSRVLAVSILQLETVMNDVVYNIGMVVTMFSSPNTDELELVPDATASFMRAVAIAEKFLDSPMPHLIEASLMRSSSFCKSWIQTAKALADAVFDMVVLRSHSPTKNIDCIGGVRSLIGFALGLLFNSQGSGVQSPADCHSTSTAGSANCLAPVSLQRHG